MPKKKTATQQNVVQRRPAESTALASTLALLVARYFGVDDLETVTAIAVVIGAVPMVVTWIVETFKG